MAAQPSPFPFRNTKWVERMNSVCERVRQHENMNNGFMSLSIILDGKLNNNRLLVMIHHLLPYALRAAIHSAIQYRIYEYILAIVVHVQMVNQCSRIVIEALLNEWCLRSSLSAAITALLLLLFACNWHASVQMYSSSFTSIGPFLPIAWNASIYV